MDTAVCYRYQIDGGGWKTPQQKQLLGSDREKHRHPAARQCLDLKFSTGGTKGPFNSPKSLTGLVNGQIATGLPPKSGSRAAGTGTTQPTGAMFERQDRHGFPDDHRRPSTRRKSRVGYELAGFGDGQHRLLDSASQPWNRGSVWGDNRLWSTTSMAYNSGNTFNFSATCSERHQVPTQPDLHLPDGYPTGDGTLSMHCRFRWGCHLTPTRRIIADNVAGQPNTFHQRRPDRDRQYPPTRSIPRLSTPAPATRDRLRQRVDRHRRPNTSITGGPAEGSSSADTPRPSPSPRPKRVAASNVRSTAAATRPAQADTPAAGHRWPHFLGAGDRRRRQYRPPPPPAASRSPGRPTPRRRTHRSPPDRPRDRPQAIRPRVLVSPQPRPAAASKCRVDSPPFATCTSPHTTATLSDGRAHLPGLPTDSAGNTDPSQASRSFTVATGTWARTPPETTITTNLPGGQTGDTTPTFGSPPVKTAAASNARSTRAPSPRAPARAPTGTLALGPTPSA